ncbi:MAG: M1 family aminopeptidase [Bacteroidales bacterium]
MKKIFFTLFLSLFCASHNINSQTDSIDVQHYEINLNVDNIITKGHIGNTEIKFDLTTKQYNKVQFDLLNQTVDSVYVGNTTINIPIGKTEFSYDGNKLTFSIPNYPTLKNYIAIIYYHGTSTVEENEYAWGGLHYDENIIYSMGIAFLDYPHTYARSWFVCNDTFTDKATYTLNISVDKDKEAFCSGKFVEKQTKQDFDTYKYTIPQNISPYLVAITIGKFHTYTKNIHSQTYNYDIPLVVKYTNESDLPNIEHNFTGIEKAFNMLEQHFGRFRFNRIGYCITPKGSMEHVDNISLSRGAITDTSINGVSNIVHELGHSWFGNLATCVSEKEMWLNEGWATYSTRLSLEAIYGENKAKDYWRNKHEWVMKNLPLKEGIKSVTPIDSTLTYSSTVYEKGSMIAKTIQGYFPDSLFFYTIKAMLDSFEYKNYSSYQLRDFIASHTQDNNFKDFFNHLVFEDKQINYDLFENKNGDYEFRFNYSEYDSLLNIPITIFNSLVCADYEERLMTLNTDNALCIDTVGIFKFKNTYSQIKTLSTKDYNGDNFLPLCIRSTLHWTGPYQDSLPEGVEKISKQHYWTIQTTNINEVPLQLQLYFELDNSSLSFDSTLVGGYFGKDSIILLHRNDINSPWEAIPFSMPNSNKGYLTTNFLQQGDYAMAVGDKNKVSLMNYNNIAQDIRIAPNPSNNITNIYCREWENTVLTAYKIDGIGVFEIKLTKQITPYQFKDKGMYILRFTNKNKTISKKVLIN